MAKKLKKSTPDQPGQAPLSDTLRDSAQQIWLAGLGAFSQAQAQGGKVFETLVREGLTLQRKTQAAAKQRLAEASSQMTAMTAVSGAAGGLQTQPGERGDRLEALFEDRVAKALGKIGVPSAEDINALHARLDQLDRQVQQMKDAATTKLAAAKRLKTRPAS